MTRRGITPQERFWAKVDKHGAVPAYRPDLGPCWLWNGTRTWAGYGQFGIDGRDRRAHRLSYAWLVGAVPPGLVLDHLCRVRHCVNPAHLEAVTSQENKRRGVSPVGVTRTHCMKGHVFTPQTTKIDAGKRRCLICVEARRALAAAKDQAYRRLAELHPAEFERLLASYLGDDRARSAA